MSVPASDAEASARTWVAISIASAFDANTGCLGLLLRKEHLVRTSRVWLSDLSDLSGIKFPRSVASGQAGQGARPIPSLSSQKVSGHSGVSSDQGGDGDRDLESEELEPICAESSEGSVQTCP